MTRAHDGKGVGEEIEEIKDRLISAWRMVYHTSVSGTPDEQEDADSWAVVVEREAKQALAARIERRCAEAEARVVREAVDYIDGEIDSGVPVELAWRTVLLQMENDKQAALSAPTQALGKDGEGDR